MLLTPRMVHASERPAAGLRMGVRRRQSAGACLGHLARLPDRPQARSGTGDRAFLERVFHKLMLNFTWWVNRKDAEGRNIFQGGFLGLDNIGVFDRSAPLPTGGYIDQADGTGWMAMYTLNLMRIALELARRTGVRGHRHQVLRALPLHRRGHDQHRRRRHRPVGRAGRVLLRRAALPDGSDVPLRVRSMVGLIPLFAVEVLEPELLDALPEFARAPGMVPGLPARSRRPGVALARAGHGERRLLSLLRGHRMKRLLQRMLDETEFLSRLRRARASRSTTRQHPFVLRRRRHALLGRLRAGRIEHAACSAATRTGAGRSGCRSTICSSSRCSEFHHYYGDDFKVECPTGSGTFLTLDEIAERADPAAGAALPARRAGRRPVFGDNAKLQSDPHSATTSRSTNISTATRARAGRIHQTGWTGLVALLLQPRFETEAYRCPAAPGRLRCARSKGRLLGLSLGSGDSGFV